MLNLNTELLIGILRIVALVTILFVWVIRYDIIKNEFKEYYNKNVLDPRPETELIIEAIIKYRQKKNEKLLEINL